MKKEMKKEMRLIDANALLENLGEEPMVWSDGEAEIQERNDWQRFKACVEAQDTVDAVEVVRCKDCKHLNVLNRKDLYAHCPKTNTVFLPFELDTRTHYCSLGERKDNG